MLLFTTSSRINGRCTVLRYTVAESWCIPSGIPAIQGIPSILRRRAFSPLPSGLPVTRGSSSFKTFRPQSDSYLRFSLTCPLPSPDSIRFHYSNIPAYLIGVALTEAVQEDAWAFINRSILSSLHITDAEYARCPDGYFYGASGMKLSVHDLSQIGLLLIQGGTFEGNRIVSEDYVKRATSVQQMNREGGYGYFFWKYGDGFSINGKWGQRCYVLPGQNTVITYLCDMPNDSDGLISSMERSLLGLQPLLV